MTAQSAEFLASGFFVLRTPLLPIDELLQWSDGLEAAAAPANTFEKALAADRARLRHRLGAASARPEVREALFVASPDLEESLEHWRRQPDSKDGLKTERALVRYFARMAGRATPFGLFAGCSVGVVGNETRLVLAARAEYQRHTRLDMDYLGGLADALAADDSLQHLLTYRPNPSLYRAAGRLHYVEGRRAGKNRSHHLSAVEETDYLQATLERAAAGANRAALANALISEDISPGEAAEYIGALITEHILVPDLVLPLTGVEPIQPFIHQLRQYAAMAAPAEVLDQTQKDLTALDAAGLGAPSAHYRAVAARLEKLPAPVDRSLLFQVDLLKPAPESRLGGAALAELERGIHILHKLATRPGDTVLTRFRAAFRNRYEEREVPLTLALDDDAGIGFPPTQGAGTQTGPLLEGLAFPAESDTLTWVVGRHDFLLEKLTQALATGAQEIVLDAADLERLAAKDPLPLPDAFALSAVLAAENEAALDRGAFRALMKYVGGPSGATILGRFCHADSALLAHVERHLRAEEALQPEAVFAEIVHLSQGRLGNVSARPLLRHYEIPCLGQSGAPLDRQLPLADLRLCLRGERLVLRSARLGREVVPRLTNAHNYHGQGFGAYQFLCLLQDQGRAGTLGWDWGPLYSAPFLPRVATGRLVLALARWRVAKDELQLLGKARESARFQAVQAWRARRRLPRLIALADADNSLPIDLDNVLSVEAFVHLVKERDEATLIELFGAPDQLCARGPEGRFVHELIVPFVRKPATGVVADGAANDLVAARFQRADAGTLETCRHIDRVAIDKSVITARHFPPGSEWLYAKLYTSAASADQVLREAVAPLCADVVRSGAAERWFFIRYSDPDWHLRLRFHGQPGRLHAEVLPALHAAVAPLLRDGRIWRVQIDTYEREVERYGGAHGIELAEQIFQVDSQAVLELLDLVEPGDRGLDERWRLALCGVHLLLTDFGFDLSARQALLQKLRAGLGKELAVDKRLEQQVGAKFRTERRSLESLVSPDSSLDHPLLPGIEALRRRSTELAPLVAAIKALDQRGRLPASIADLAGSFAHMHVNRLLRSAQRPSELVIYDFLRRLYASQGARVDELF